MVVTSPVIPYTSLLNAVKFLPHTSVEDKVVTVAACEKMKRNKMPRCMSGDLVLDLFTGAAVLFSLFDPLIIRKNGHARTWVDEHRCDILSIV